MIKRKILFFVRVIYLFNISLLVGCQPTSKDNLPFEVIPATPSPQAVLVPVQISGQVVYSVFSDNQNSLEKILLTNLDTEQTIELTKSGNNSAPQWSPDGKKILFLSWTNEQQYDIKIMGIDGSNQEPIMSTNANERMAGWSPDGRKVVFISDQTGNDEIYIINLETKIISKVTNTLVNESFPQWSSSGNQIAFISSKDTSGRLQVFTMKTDGSNVKQVSTYNLDNFDRDPTWCMDDSCLVFTRLGGPATLMLLDLDSMQETSLLSDVFQAKDNQIVEQSQPAISPVRGYLTFAANNMFYAMDMNTREIYPLNIQALTLSLYP